MINLINFVRGTTKECDALRKLFIVDKAGEMMIMLDTESNKMYFCPDENKLWSRMDSSLADAFLSGYMPNIFGSMDIRFKMACIDADVLLEAHVAKELATAEILNDTLKGQDVKPDAPKVRTEIKNKPARNSSVVKRVVKKKTRNRYNFKGSIDTYAALTALTGMAQGDVYNVVSDESTGSTGMNYAYNGTTWDSLGGTFAIASLSNSEIDTIIAS